MKPKIEYAITPEGGDAYTVVNKTTGEAHEVQRFLRADAKLKAICTCGGVRDIREPLLFCDHLVSVDIFVERINGNERNAEDLERVYSLAVNVPEKKPCSVQVIKRCAAIAGECGLDFSKKHKMGRRAAAALVVGHFVESCQELSESEWVAFADEIKNWRLRWDAKSAWYENQQARAA